MNGTKDFARLISFYQEKGWTLSSAESMTAGAFGAALCSVPGASKIYLGGVISYAPSVKEKLLGVPSSLIEEKGVVSPEVALAMAKGARESLCSTYAVSVTGNAGPTAEPGEAPVGRVYLGFAGPASSAFLELNLKGERNEIRAQAVEAMLQLLIQETL